MKFIENITSQSVYESFLHKDNLSFNELLQLARYPYISLSEYCGNINNYEEKKVKEIEDMNIFYFLNAFKIVMGFGTVQESSVFQKSLTQEPLRTAVILAQNVKDDKERIISLYSNAIRILLSPQNGNELFRDPINIGIVGNMPRYFSKSRQSMADNWYSNFVELKLYLFGKICKILDITESLSIMMMSIAYSLYKYTPYRYHISDYKCENENLQIILTVFMKQIDKIKNK